MTDRNNSLENIYLAKVPKSHVVVGCEYDQGGRGYCYVLQRCENGLVAFSEGNAK